MSAVIEFEIKKEHYLSTIKALRTKNFSKNLPFLILSDKLPDGQVYREFADGHIELQEVSSKGGVFEYRVIKTLSNIEANQVRKVHGLL
ncbi:hypothetical protein [Pedobacter ginsengisoli]|uniref:hypothetical protein n=1 Tax=Pedobacter ginsengisoli TaxID=363852 RepID=UPI00254D8FD2|nr:hypothetical protein [Pedobacter ginsengisoli]